MKKISIILVFVAVLSLTSCGNKKTTSQPTQEAYKEQHSESTSSPDYAQPYDALEEIYANVDIKGVEEADEEFVNDTLGLTHGEQYKEAYIMKSDGSYGVADVYIIECEKDQHDIVKKSLEKIKEQRIKDFKDYSIFNSYEIAQGADIYRHGDYMIMLMLENKEESKEIIKKYLPK